MTKKKVPQRANKKGKLQTRKQMATDKRSRYTDLERRQIGLVYMMKGSAKATAEACKADFPTLAHTTILSWTKTEWWHEQQGDLEEEYERKVRGKMNSIIELAANETLDRLQNGDAVLGKDGEIKRVPVRARDSMVIAGVAIDKRRLSLNMPTAITSNSGSKHLEELAKVFDKIAKESEYRTIRQKTSIPGELE
jgi:hypothetical protein